METISQCLRKERKEFDEIFDITKLYISACSNSVLLVPLHSIIISILFHHYKELKECMTEVKQMEERKVNNKHERRLLLEVKEEQKEQALLTDY